MKTSVRNALIIMKPGHPVKFAPGSVIEGNTILSADQIDIELVRALERVTGASLVPNEAAAA